MKDRLKNQIEYYKELYEALKNKEAYEVANEDYNKALATKSRKDMLHTVITDLEKIFIA